MTRYSLFMVIGAIVLVIAAAICGLITASVVSYLGYQTSIFEGSIYWIAIIGFRETCKNLHKCSEGYASGVTDEN